jgi:hypothetical protein
MVVLLLAEREERSHNRNEVLIVFISTGCDLMVFLVHRIGRVHIVKGRFALERYENDT